jgi:hypothetical protein
MIWNGVPLGFDGPGEDAAPISYSKDDDGSGNAPTLVFGPPGSSKTVGLIATALLDDESARSYVVIDPKGELCAISSKFRRSLPGHTVKIINPYGLLTDVRGDMISDGWNPLGDLDPANPLTFVDEAQAKGEALIKTGSNEHQPHFPDSARSGMTAAIMFESRDADAQTPALPRSLPNARAVMTLESEKLRTAVEKMIESGDWDISTRARKFLDTTNEIQSIKSTIETQTAWMTPPIRADMVREGGVDFRDCAKKPTTIYVIIPATELQSKSTYIRLVLSSALRGLYKYGGVPTTLIVEEAFILQYHAEIEQALSVLRGFGSRMTVVFQSLQQIRKLYPQTWGLFTAGAVLAFRPADTDTAKWLVEKAGKEVVPVFGAQEPRPGELIPQGGWTQKERDRIPLHKMFGMPRGRAVVWKPHDEAPRISWVRGYFDIPELARKSSPNPYWKGGSSAGRRARRGIAAMLAAAAVIAGGVWLSHVTGLSAGAEVPAASPQPTAAPARHELGRPHSVHHIL